MIRLTQRQYNVQPGEMITVTVQSTGTVHAVNTDLDGQGGGPLAANQPLIFQITNQTRVLTLLFTFTNPSGGDYVVTIRGSLGGVDSDVVGQGEFGIPVTSSEYRFQL